MTSHFPARKHVSAIAASVLILGLAACAPTTAKPPEAAAPAEPAPVTLAPIEAPAGTYVVDPYHATVAFRVNHLGLSIYNARFKKFAAEFTFDPANPTAAAITGSVDTSSVETDYSGNFKAGHPDSPYKTFNEALVKDPAWFDATKFPTMSFKSTGLTVTSPTGGDMAGELTLKGVTKPVTFAVTLVGAKAEHPFVKGVGAMGFTARTTIKRSEWGLDNSVPFVADDVEIIFDGEFTQKKA